MEIFKDKIQLTNKITLGGDKMVLFSGPCAAESYDICYETGVKVKEICEELGIDYVFKSSFDKANRTSGASKREAFLASQKEIKAKYPNPYYWGAFVMMGQ